MITCGSAPRLQMAVGTNGLPSLSVAAVGVVRFTVQATTDFLTWTNLATVNFPNGTVPIEDPDRANFPARFYRVRMD